LLSHSPSTLHPGPAEQLQSGLKHFSELDYNSAAAHPRLTDGWQRLRPDDDQPSSPFSTRSYLIFDIRMLVTSYATKTALGTKWRQLGQPTPAGLGFAIVPVLGPGRTGWCVLSGNLKLPVYTSCSTQWAGKPLKEDKMEQWLRTVPGPPAALLDMLVPDVLSPDGEEAAAPDLPAIMNQAEGRGLIRRLPEVSLLCRIADPARQPEFETPFAVESEPQRVNSRLIPPAAVSEYTRRKGKSDSRPIFEVLGDVLSTMGEGGSGKHRADSLKTFLRSSNLKPPHQE